MNDDASNDNIRGIISTTMILMFASPLTMAAETKSRFLNVIIWDRITRAFQAQPVRTNTLNKVPGDGGNQLARITISGSPGMTRKIFINSDKISSTLPP